MPKGEGRAGDGVAGKTDAAGLSRVTYDERLASGYYIYGLIDPRAWRETGGDKLLSIFYVGKGKASRWRDHENDERRALAKEIELLERRGSKAERIREILDRAETVQAVRLSAGYVDNDDAYFAETLAIGTVQAALDAASRPPLTNATPGHKAGFVMLREHFTYVDVTETDIDAAQAMARPTALTMFVKGTHKSLTVPGQQLIRSPQLPLALTPVSKRIKAVELLDDDHPHAFERRGWDPLDPWDDVEARDRAWRYWPAATGKVAEWLGGTYTGPTTLLLGIPTETGQTVARYAWSINPEGQWDYYPRIDRWGLPLGERLREHPLLGHCLYATPKQARRQILHGYVAGARVLQLPT